MANTGAPWNIPYVEPSDLVREYPTDSEALADAIAAGLDAAGGLVAVKSAIFTGTQTESVTAGNNVAVDDLTITHALADAGNRLIISAFIGAAGHSEQQGQTGIAIHDGTGLIGIGAAAGSRTQVGAGGRTQGTGTANTTLVVANPSVTFVHTPGDTTSRTYTVRAINIEVATHTLFINRMQSDSDSGSFVRAVSSLVITEVKV